MIATSHTEGLGIPDLPGGEERGGGLNPPQNAPFFSLERILTRLEA